MITTITPSGWLPIKTWTYVFCGVWTPVFMTWLGVVIFDSTEMRNLMHDAIHVSMAGPYLLYWVAMGDMFMNAQWTNWLWWVVGSTLLLYSVASIFFQAIFVPKVTNWLDVTPIKIYPESSDASNAADNTATDADPKPKENADPAADTVVDSDTSGSATNSTSTDKPSSLAAIHLAIDF